MWCQRPKAQLPQAHVSSVQLFILVNAPIKLGVAQFTPGCKATSSLLTRGYNISPLWGFKYSLNDASCDHAFKAKPETEFFSQKRKEACTEIEAGGA